MRNRMRPVRIPAGRFQTHQGTVVWGWLRESIQKGCQFNFNLILGIKHQFVAVVVIEVQYLSPNCNAIKDGII